MKKYLLVIALLSATIKLCAQVPTITNVAPMVQVEGEYIIINGQNFDHITSVLIGGLAPKFAQVINLAATQLEVVVPVGCAPTGLTVTTTHGTVSVPNFRIVKMPNMSVSGPTTFITGGSVTFSFPNDPDWSYQWVGDGTSSQPNKFTVKKGGIYSVFVVLENGPPNEFSPRVYFTVTEIQKAPHISYPAATLALIQGPANYPFPLKNTGGAVPSLTSKRFYVSTVDSTDNPNSFALSPNSNPFGLALDPINDLYVADKGSSWVLKYRFGNPDNGGLIFPYKVGTTPGYLDERFGYSQFKNPTGITSDPAGGIYVADSGNNAIRRINSPYGSSFGALYVTTIAGSPTAGSTNGTGAAASFSGPSNLVFDYNGNLYVTDSGNNLIRKITPAGVVSTFAGSGAAGSADGTSTAASFNNPWGIAIDASGNLYVTDMGGNLIRKITPAGVVTTMAGTGSAGAADGTGTAASFNHPAGIAVDFGKNIYIADSGNNLIRRITPAGVVTTIAGSGVAGYVNGQGTATRFNNPTGLIIGNDGTLYVMDTGNKKIRTIPTVGFSATPDLSNYVTIGLNGDITGPVEGAGLLSPGNYTITAYNQAGSSSTVLNLSVVPVPAAPVIRYAARLPFKKNGVIAPLTPSTTGGTPAATDYPHSPLVSLLAGQTASGGADGTGALASLSSPQGVITDAKGNVFVADYGSNKIRMVTPQGVVTTFAGSGTAGASNGAATTASFSGPAGLVFDSGGNLFVVDRNNSLIREISPAGVVSTFAGSTAGYTDATGTAAKFNKPTAIAIDSHDNLYVTDNLRVRKITAAAVVSTIAGGGVANAFNDGTGTGANFSAPGAMVFDADGNLYVTDSHGLRKVTPGGVVTTVPGTSALNNGVTIDATGNIYMSGPNEIIKLSPNGTVRTIAGNGPGYLSGLGNPEGARFRSPEGITFDTVGNMYIADAGNNRIRKMNVMPYTIIPALPKGLSFNGATGTISGTPLELSPSTVYTASAFNEGGTGKTTLTLSVIEGALPPDISYPGSPATFTVGTAITPLAPVNSGGPVPAATYGEVTTPAGNGTAGVVNGNAANASFNSPFAVTFGTAGNMYVADAMNNRIRSITTAGIVTTLAGSGAAGSGNGTGPGATFNYPTGIVADKLGNLYVADQNNNLIRKVTAGGVVTTFAGSGAAGAADGTGTAASFNHPYSITIDGEGNFYVADTYNNLIRKITAGGVVTTFAGSGAAGAVNATGTAASFNHPFGIATDYLYNVYVTDGLNNLIRKISPAGVVITMSGSGAVGAENGAAKDASYNSPYGIVVDSLGFAYVADKNNNTIRKLTPAGAASSFAGHATPYNKNGIGTRAYFHGPAGLAFDSAGNLFVADNTNNVIRKVSTMGYSIFAPQPGGLLFDGTTGTISGTPTVASAAHDYSVIAYNAAGSSKVIINLAVQPTSSMFMANALQYSSPIPGEPKVSPALSPNGDGSNDVLTIDNIDQYPDNNLVIMTSGGSKVYEATGYGTTGKLFNGHSNVNGKLQTAGTYFYQLEYKNSDGETQVKKGYFLIKY